MLILFIQMDKLINKIQNNIWYDKLVIDDNMTWSLRFCIEQTLAEPAGMVWFDRPFYSSSRPEINTLGLIFAFRTPYFVGQSGKSKTVIIITCKIR